jgi:DNA (cytosine-5)-methyltransferase 1
MLHADGRPGGALKTLDLFCGAGGLSLGLEKAGFEVVAAVDSNHDACETYASIFPGADLHCASTTDLDFAKFRGIDLVAGAPPCQPFSAGGKRMADQDARDMLPEFLRAVREVRPSAFLMENVYGLGQAGTRGYLKQLLGELEGLHYFVSAAVLNAADYGVPQKRRRLFIVGMRAGKFTWPAPSHGPLCRQQHVAAGTVLSKHEPIGTANLSKVFYAKNPDLRPSPYDGHLFNGGGRPIDLSQPSPTILASAGGNKTHFIDTLDEVPPYHRHLMRGGGPRQGTLPGGRRFTANESALLQTFPKHARFAGSTSSRYTQVGNAVPPRLAAVVGRAVARALRASHRELELGQQIHQSVNPLDSGLVAI